jgi:hypothetical protein
MERIKSGFLAFLLGTLNSNDKKILNHTARQHEALYQYIHVARAVCDIYFRNLSDKNHALKHSNDF